MIFFNTKKPVTEPEKKSQDNIDLQIINKMNQEFAVSLDLNETLKTALELIKTENHELIQNLAERLLQHQYILSVEAIQLSDQAYVEAAQLNKVIGIRYANIIANTSRDFQDSHFFKKEEVKWSWEASSPSE